jgi:hypothetical protein
MLGKLEVTLRAASIYEQPVIREELVAGTAVRYVNVSPEERRHMLLGNRSSADFGGALDYQVENS